MSNLRIGLVGAGIMGEGHAGYLTKNVPGADLVAICEPREEVSNRIAKDLEIQPSLWTDFEKMLDGVALDGVIIASPDRFHAWSVGLCMDREIPALCEKPLAESLADAKDVHRRHSELEKKRGRPLIHLGFMRRFDRAYQEAKRIIDSQELGRVLYVNASTRNVSSEGITSSQLLTNIAVHEIDVFRWLLGAEWAEIKVNYPPSTALAPVGVSDPIVLTGSMSDSTFVVADIFAHNNYGYDVRTEITLERGVVRIGIFGDLAVTRDHTYTLEHGGPMENNWIPRFENAYISELGAWTQTLRGELNPDLATVDDGLRVLEVLDSLLAD